MLIIVIFPLFFLTLFLYNFFWKRRNFPPGPTPLPLVGNTLALALDPPGYGPFQRWARKFGPVYTYWMGEDAVVVVTDYQIMKETFLKDGDAYTGRYFTTALFDAFTETNGYNHGVARSEGDVWRQLRRFLLYTLRNLGVGKTSLENKMLNNVHHFIKSIKEEKLEGTDVHDLGLNLDHYAGSIINELLFGYSFVEEKLEEFNELKKMSTDLHKWVVAIPGQIISSSPWIRHLPYFSGYFKEMDNAITQLYRFVERNVVEKIAKRNRDKGASNVGVGNQLLDDESEMGLETDKDFVDLFLDKMELEQSAAAQDKQQDKYFTMDNIKALGFDLFVGGQETSSSTLNFLFLYLLLDQRVQHKLCAEIDLLMRNRGGSVDSSDEDITMADRTKLPYLEAVINETQRLCNIAPNNLAHRTTRDVVVGGYRLGKGTNIVPQLSSVLFNEKIFANPDKFIPERFIGEDGQFKKPEELIAFGIGKRNCPGEQLARIEMFLLVANFFKNFKILPEDPQKLPSVEKRMHLVVLPHKYKCRIESRF